MAENTQEDEQDINPMEKGKQPDQGQTDQIRQNTLTSREVDRLKNKQVTIKQLASERMRLKSAAEAELNDLAKGPAGKSPLISQKEYSDIQKQLNDTDSADKTQNILDQLRDLPRMKEEAAQKDKDKARELAPDDPQLLELEKQFGKICDDNKHLIGEGQVASFKAWIEQERKKKPTIGHLEEQIAKLEGTKTQDKNGLAPRREEYGKLTDLFKKYGINSPLENAYVKKEGLSERKDFRKQAEALEEHFSKLKDTGFYSPEMVQKTMQEALKAENPQAIAAKLKEAADIGRKESEGFTHLDAKHTVGGITVNKMSKASLEEYTKYYRTLSLKDRKEQGVNQWKMMVDNEAALSKHSPNFAKLYADNGVKALDEIYKDNPDALRMALQSFGHLDFMAKIASLREHEKLATNLANKEELQKELIGKAAKAEIGASASKKDISGDTKDRYIKFFDDPNNFKNPTTHKPGDLQAMQKAYDILVSTSPNEQYKNLAAYAARRKAYQKDIDELQKINPNISDEEIKKMQAKYDKEGWTRRAFIHEQELKPRISEEKAKQTARRELEIKAGKKESSESKDAAPELKKTLEAAGKLILEKNGAEAMKILLAYNEHDPDNKEVIFWMGVAADSMKQFGTGKKREATVIKELEKEVEEVAKNDSGIQQEMMEQQLKTLNLKGNRQSQERNNKTISAHERAQKDSAKQAPEGSLEADLTASAYEQMGDDFIINKEGTGEKLQQVQFKNADQHMLEQDRFKLKQATYKKQQDLVEKKGIVVEVKNKDGQEISAEVAEAMQQKELNKLQEDLAKKAEDKVAARTAKPKGGADLFDLTSRIAARRKAKELIDAKRSEQLKAA